MQQQPASKLQTSVRWSITVGAWMLAIVALATSTAWIFGGGSYRVDLLANLGAQLLLLWLVLCILIAIVRRWRALIVVLLACVFQATPLLRFRAAYFPKQTEALNARRADTIRFLHYNDSSLSDKREVYALMDRSGADVLSILSPPVYMQFDVINGPGLEDIYPGKLIRPWKPAPDKINTEVSPGFVVSRWPLTPYDCAFVGPMSDRFIAGIVERPSGRFALIAVHPRSPRTAQRWHEGNAVVLALVALSRKLQAEGLSVVVLTDLNSTPTGWRSREACAEGNLRRAKPLLTLDGTYPDVVPLDIRTGRTTSIPATWPASIAIDDALVSPGIEVRGWETLPPLHSEHRPVIVELAIPATRVIQTPNDQ